MRYTSASATNSTSRSSLVSVEMAKVLILGLRKFVRNSALIVLNPPKKEQLFTLPVAARTVRVAYHSCGAAGDSRLRRGALRYQPGPVVPEVGEGAC